MLIACGGWVLGTKSPPRARVLLSPGLYYRPWCCPVFQARVPGFGEEPYYGPRLWWGMGSPTK